ncbi:mechanosensitive ion channel family protein [Gallaecimonas sp. GXIMD1310]|uniref:mechanosensitive ion channel family protein n=1 Tax=Gallaecimonas sp. GXIMD1310 TaxID=3131926 RepID=UPI00324E0C21
MLDDQVQLLQKLTTQVVNFLTNYGFQLVGALLTILLGWLLAGWLGRSVKRLGDKRHWDPTLVRFFSNLARLVLLAFFLVMAASKLGITISPLIAAIGAATFGLSLAVQGPVSNYGAGLALILTRPFVVGDTLHIQGRDGQVEAINLAQTVLVNEDGERIYIPNRKVLGEIFHNSQQYRLAETTLLLPQGSDPNEAIAVLQAMLGEQALTQWQVGIDAFTPMGVQLMVRAWLQTSHYHQQRMALNLALYQCLQSHQMTPASPGVALWKSLS